MDVSETKQENPETWIHKVISDFITLIQRSIRVIHISKFAILKRGISQQNSKCIFV